jgi:hypothetical protein
VAGRLGAYGFDGGQLTGRLASAIASSPDTSASAGAGFQSLRQLERLEPQGQYRPAESPLVAGLRVLDLGHAEVTAEYRREVDQTTDYFASERVAASATIRPFGAWSLVGGAIYDMASGLWGSADAAVRFASPKVGVVAGYRRYAPFYELWTVWGAFSPVPYNAWYGSVSVQAAKRLGDIAYIY